MREIRSGTGISWLGVLFRAELTWEREGKVSWWTRCSLGRVGEQQVLHVRLLVSFNNPYGIRFCRTFRPPALILLTTVQPCVPRHSIKEINNRIGLFMSAWNQSSHEHLTHSSSSAPVLFHIDPNILTFQKATTPFPIANNPSLDSVTTLFPGKSFSKSTRTFAGNLVNLKPPAPIIAILAYLTSFAGACFLNSSLICRPPLDRASGEVTSLGSVGMGDCCRSGHPPPSFMGAGIASVELI